MLTVRYRRLELRAGMRLLDVGCGGGRHAFEAARRGAAVVAVDAAVAELGTVAATFAAQVEAGEVRRPGQAVAGDTLALPFPDGAFDRIVAAEVLEHLENDVAALAELVRVLGPGGVLAVTVPSWLPERVCWALSPAYHAPAVPGGHVRIYTARTLRRRLGDAGLVAGGAHRSHALHSPYWWVRCAVGPGDSDHPLVRAYHRFLVWDLMRGPWVTRLAETVLNPVLGKSLVLYARKAGG